MSDIKASIAKTLVHEGGYVNDSRDSGGETKYGITAKDLPGVSIRDLTEDQAVAYYKEHYIKPLYVQITDQAKLDKLFDFGVLFGVGEAIILLQRALGVFQDGKFGQDTLDAVNATDVLQNYKNAVAGHVEQIIIAHPQDAAFRTGWLNRINS